MFVVLHDDSIRTPRATFVRSLQSSWSWSQSVHENRIYSVNIHCGDSYPDQPPTIQFVSRVNLPCVDQRTGKVRREMIAGRTYTEQLKVDPSKLPCLVNWKRENSMETILIELRRYARTRSCYVRAYMKQIHGSSTAQEATTAPRGNDLLSWRSMVLKEL